MNKIETEAWIHRTDWQLTEGTEEWSTWWKKVTRFAKEHMHKPLTQTAGSVGRGKQEVGWGRGGQRRKNGDICNGVKNKSEVKQESAWIIKKLKISQYSFKSFFNHYLLLFKYSCLHFPTTTIPGPTHPHLPPSILLPFGFVHGSFKHVPWQPFSFILPLSPTTVHSGYYQFVLYFSVYGGISLACLFCWLGSTYRWDYVVLVFYCLAYFT